MQYDHNTHQIVPDEHQLARGRTTAKVFKLPRRAGVPLTDARPHIMTEDGWKPLLPVSSLTQEIMRNPFRCHASAGYASFEDWVRAN